jgi:hypothetical protein
MGIHYGICDYRRNSKFGSSVRFASYRRRGEEPSATAWHSSWHTNAASAPRWRRILQRRTLPPSGAALFGSDSPQLRRHASAAWAGTDAAGVHSSCRRSLIWRARSLCTKAHRECSCVSTKLAQNFCATGRGVRPRTLHTTARRRRSYPRLRRIHLEPCDPLAELRAGEVKMSHYRCYILDQEDKVKTGTSIEADDDAGALNLAAKT